MKKLVVFLVLLLGVSTTAVAQDVSVADLFGGYSYIRCGDVGFQRNVGGENPKGSCDLHGWNAGVDINFNSNWAVTADVSGHYGQIDLNIDESANYKTRYYDAKYLTFIFGPKYTFGVSERVRPYVHALYGFSRVSTSNLTRVARVDIPATATAPEVKAGDSSAHPNQLSNETNFVQAYGGGVDVKLIGKWSARPVQLDYFVIRRYSNFENNLRISAGIVYRIGEK